MKIPLIDLAGQHRKIRKSVLRAAGEVFDSQKFILSRNVKLLENKIAALARARFGVGVASGSDAIYLALLALGIGAGDEVITTPFTFFATAGSISRTGAKPVFADIDPRTFNLDPKLIQAKVTRRTKAILPVHLFGLACELSPILSVARKNGLFVIEDAAQSFGAQYRGKPIGGLGDAGCFSFYPTKNLGGAGDGGMVVAHSEILVKKIRKFRDHGSSTKYHHEMIGMNSRLDELQAAVLLVKLKYIDAWNRRRRRIASLYDRGLRGLPLQTPFVPKGHTHVFHLYSVLTKDRDALKDFLLQNGVGAGVYYPLPLHLQPCYRELGYKKGDFPKSEYAAEHILSLPMYPELSNEAVWRVVGLIKKFFDSSS